MKHALNGWQILLKDCRDITNHELGKCSVEEGEAKAKKPKEKAKRLKTPETGHFGTSYSIINLICNFCDV